MSTVAKKLLSVYLVLTALNPAPFLLAQNDSEIRVEQIIPSIRDRTLAVSAEFRNLFSKKITGTIQSGLPSIIQIEIRLQDGKGKSVLRKRLTRTVSYDIWEERYTVLAEDSAYVFTDFEAAKEASQRLDNEALPPLRGVNDNQRYVVQIRVGIVPISTRQAEKVTDWLLDPNQTEEAIASENRASGFQLNLNKLVSFFVSSKKKSSYASEWFSSTKFRLRDLRP